ncbi:KTSC domain-containing protein [Pseudaminobacter sp. NGMCC 1.201702]|uniref:KTSC domain-containing protein n=1 Tax=Pseudaminobacter sp. NGMCC 1.201702 TaxID=3391825 RepID=UPI0039F02EF4
MDREPVSSSNLASVGYDPASEILEIEFNNGRVYQYYNFPQFMHERMMEAPSIGSFFNAEIKNAYSCSQV